MAKINEIDITSLTFQEGSAPTTPASTKWKIYTKTDGLYVVDDAGTETGPLGTGGGGGYPTFSGASLTKSSTQSVNATAADISFDGEVYDTDTYHDNSTNNTRLTVPATGYYLIGGTISVLNATGTTNIAEFHKNGSAVNGWGFARSDSTGLFSLSLSVVASLTASDYVELEFETSGNKTVRESSNGTSFWITRLA